MKNSIKIPSLITADQVRELLRYEPETGKLFWLPRRSIIKTSERVADAWNIMYAGKEAFTASSTEGYKVGAIFDKKYIAHRVIWAVYYGHWPVGQIDHINGVRNDNRIENLRDVSHIENGRNTKIHITNTSGTAGVSFYKKLNKWHARIKDDGRHVHLGYFHDINDAIAARKTAEIKLGFHENHGRLVNYTPAERARLA